MLRRVALLSLLVLAPASAHAHDYWLAPRDYTPAVGEPVTVDLFVGDHLVPQSSRPHDPDKADSFTLRHRCSHEDLTRSLAAGADPVLERAFDRDGLVLLAARGFSRVSPRAEEFVEVGFRESQL